jgi:hypothetical protein
MMVSSRAVQCGGVRSPARRPARPVLDTGEEKFSRQNLGRPLSRTPVAGRREGDGGQLVPATAKRRNTMRFMTMIKSDESMPWGPPPPALWEAMAAFAQEGALNGTLIEQAGLGSSAQGAIVSLANGSIKVIDGPFAESKELIGGYAVTEVRSKEEAIELGRRLLQIHLDNWPGWEGSCEIRQLFLDTGEAGPS